MRYGTATAPWWVSFLDMAEAWGRPPWEITGRDDQVVWITRYREYVRIRAVIEKERAEKING